MVNFNSARSQVIKFLNKYRGFNGDVKGTNGHYNITSTLPIQHPQGEILKMKLVTGTEFRLRVLHFIFSPSGSVLLMTKDFKDAFDSSDLKDDEKKLQEQLKEYIQNRKPRNEIKDLKEGIFNWMAYYGADSVTYANSKKDSKFFFMRAEDVANYIKASTDEIEEEAKQGILSHKVGIFKELRKRKNYINKNYNDESYTCYLTNNMYAVLNEDKTKDLEEKYSLEGWTDWSVLYDIGDFRKINFLATSEGLKPMEVKPVGKPKITIIKKADIERKKLEDEKRKAEEEKQKEKEKIILNAWGPILYQKYLATTDKKESYFGLYNNEKVFIQFNLNNRAYGYNDAGLRIAVPKKQIEGKKSYEEKQLNESLEEYGKRFNYF